MLSVRSRIRDLPCAGRPRRFEFTYSGSCRCFCIPRRWPRWRSNKRRHTRFPHTRSGYARGLRSCNGTATRPRKTIFSERNVDSPAGLKTSSCYDLALYPELGSSSRGVLIVTLIASVKFADGVASSGGAKLTWTDSDKKTFITGVQDAVRDTWSEKHRRV